MNTFIDRELYELAGGIVGLLAVGSVISAILGRRVTSERGRATVAYLAARIRACWVMAVVLLLAIATGPLGTVPLFALISFQALREFVTLAPTRHGDHRALFWSFFIITPLQYWLVLIDWYGFFSV